MADKPKGEKRFEIEEDLSKAEIPEVLPVLPLRGIVIFPSQIHPFLVSRPSSLKLIEDCGQTSKVIALAAQKNPEDEQPAPEGLFQLGTAVRILKMLRYPDQINFGIPTAEWVILLIGAAITISFTFFFTIETQGIDILMRGMATRVVQFPDF